MSRKRTTRTKEFPIPNTSPSWHETPEELAVRRETRQYVDEALATLDEKYRVVFVLRDIEELSTQETADILGLTQEAVKVRLPAGPSDASRAVDRPLWR